MRNSYIGILNHAGLSVLVPEEHNVDRFLLRRAMRENALCFWAVIDDAVVETIRAELSFGQTQDAARLLQLLAFDLRSHPSSTHNRCRPLGVTRLRFSCYGSGNTVLCQINTGIVPGFTTVTRGVAGKVTIARFREGAVVH